MALVSKESRNDEVGPIADAIAAIWQEIDDVLSGVIGKGGVAALFQRSVRLASEQHPWLECVQGGVQKIVDLSELRSVVERQDAASAKSGGDALLLAFRELLVSLIGPLLSEQLLGSVWARAMRGPSPTKPTP